MKSLLLLVLISFFIATLLIGCSGDCVVQPGSYGDRAVTLLEGTCDESLLHPYLGDFGFIVTEGAACGDELVFDTDLGGNCTGHLQVTTEVTGAGLRDGDLLLSAENCSPTGGPCEHRGTVVFVYGGPLDHPDGG